MLGKSFHFPEICVIGRCDFNSGIGAISYAACELLSRSYPVSIFPLEFHLRNTKEIMLPNGRRIPVCRNLNLAKIFFYTDVLWNSPAQQNSYLVPMHGLKIAHIAYDSDQLPPAWVDILNKKFDVLLVSTSNLEKISRMSGVEIPIATFPIGLDIEHLLTRPFLKANLKKIRFGSIVAFHVRKGLETLVDAFINTFQDRNDVELILHSNLVSDSTYERLLNKINSKNIIIDKSPLSSSEKDKLLETIDIFVNCSRGEGYSIGAREALALGKTLVLSDIDAHRELLGVPGVFKIPAKAIVPARYPELDNQIFGVQRAVLVEDVSNALRQAYEYIVSEKNNSTVMARRSLASDFSFSHLSTSYCEIINPKIRDFRKHLPHSKHVNIPKNFVEKIEKHIGQRCQKLTHKNRIVVPCHDGGFFSIFNAFLSHLTWELKNDRCESVLPDWDVSRMIKRLGTNKFVSFCYGKPNEGNIWLKIFEPLYGLTEYEMNNEESLYHNAKLPEDYFNEAKEPNLTYIHAYKLYASKNFQAFRKQYNKAFKTHIHLRPNFKQEIDKFLKEKFAGRFMIAAHVKHPSHVIEQPNGLIAGTQAYIQKIYFEIQRRGLSEKDQSWGVFLATDQDRVVSQFKSSFGDRLVYFDDVRRTTHFEDNIFDNLAPEAKCKEGFQVQHLTAASQQNWSTQMAWEVFRDALAMAACNVLLHVVSNVATAASYINPDLEMIFCS